MLRQLLLASLALAALLLTPAQSSGTATTTCYSGIARGGLFLPVHSGTGQLSGRMTTTSGQSMGCYGLLTPIITGPPGGGPWPQGSINGTVLPMAGGPAPGSIEFFGSYQTDVQGRGAFSVGLYMPNPVSGLPPLQIGTMSGQFRDAAQLDPSTQLQLPGDFLASWSACL